MKLSKLFSWICIIAVCVFSFALSVFCFIVINERYALQGAWEATKAVFAFLGILLTAATVFPVISGIISYQQYQQSIKSANKSLSNVTAKQKYLESRLTKYQQEIEDYLSQLAEKEEKLKEYVKQTEDDHRLIHYLQNENVDDEELGLVELALENKEKLRWLQKTAKSKLKFDYFYRNLYNQEDNEITQERLEDLIKLSLNKMKGYEQLSKRDRVFRELYPELLFDEIIYFTKEGGDYYKESDIIYNAIKEFNLMFERLPSRKYSLFSKGYSAKSRLENWFCLVN